MLRKSISYWKFFKWYGSRNSAVHSVRQELIFAGSEHGKIIGLKALFQNSFEPPALIFVQVFTFMHYSYFT